MDEILRPILQDVETLVPCPSNPQGCMRLKMAKNFL
jgi:hypothetical protein